MFQCAFTKLEVPEIFKGLQTSFYSKEPAFDEDNFTATTYNTKEKIYEEFSRYDTRNNQSCFLVSNDFKNNNVEINTSKTDRDVNLNKVSLQIILNIDKFRY